MRNITHIANFTNITVNITESITFRNASHQANVSHANTTQPLNNSHPPNISTTTLPSVMANTLINGTSKLFSEPTRMVKPVTTEGVDHWVLLFGFAFLFAVSVGCVYFVIRCIRGDGKAEENEGEAPRNSETSRLIPVAADGPQQHPTAASDSSPSPGATGVSASRQRFLEQRRQQVQQQSYGSTS